MRDWRQNDAPAGGEIVLIAAVALLALACFVAGAL